MVQAFFVPVHNVVYMHTELCNVYTVVYIIISIELAVYKNEKITNKKKANG